MVKNLIRVRVLKLRYVNLVFELLVNKFLLPKKSLVDVLHV
jgi:hypothetical protein